MRKLKILFGIVFLIYIIFGLLIFLFQRSFIYYPSKQDFASCPGFSNAEKIDYQGTRMYVHKSTDQWAVIYHGNAGSACDRAFLLSFLDQATYSYVFVEYTGYSNDAGKPSQAALMKNAEDAAAYVASQHPAKVKIFGESLGTALAVYHAQLQKPDAVLLISPFDALTNVARDHYPLYPVGLMLRDTYPSVQWIRAVGHIIIMHGADDTFVGADLARNLYEQAPGPNKVFVLVDRAGHNTMYGTPQVQDELKAFFGRP